MLNNDPKSTQQQFNIRSHKHQVQTRTVKMSLGRQVTASSEALKKLCVG